VGIQSSDLIMPVIMTLAHGYLLSGTYLLLPCMSQRQQQIQGGKPNHKYDSFNSLLLVFDIYQRGVLVARFFTVEANDRLGLSLFSRRPMLSISTSTG
jgi:hypothetical protein